MSIYITVVEQERRMELYEYGCLGIERLLSLDYHLFPMQSGLRSEGNPVLKAFRTLVGMKNTISNPFRYTLISGI